MKVIGLMSGSSLDGVDIAFADFKINGEQIDFELIKAETVEFSEVWQRRLRNLPKVDALAFAKTDTYFGHLLGKMVNNFIAKHQIEVDFIASHGHTIFHYPDNRLTVQIGDGAAMAAVTGLPVINNFRTHDIAINGEGTPLAPIADKYLFSGYDFYLNIGGIANISCAIDGRFVAFDIAAANQILNNLTHFINLPYDENGNIASGGKVNDAILNQVNELSYHHARYPKSLDNTWLQENILPIYLMAEDTIQNKIRTACEQLAQQTAFAIQQIIKKENLAVKPFKIFVTGGGAFNQFLMERVGVVCNQYFPTEIVVPSPEIVEYKEALLMALMGVLRVENKVNVMRSVTGAKRDTIGGAIWQGWKKMV
jgi:anhydro-N-acetylmuramic acid kinase